jgi:putative peptide zinc metalloprotease protein
MAEPQNTFSENWYRIADQNIHLRSGVKVRRQNFRGQRWIVLENPLRNQFFRLRPEAYEFIGRLRPDRTVEQVWKECLEKFPDDAPGQEAVVQLLAQLYFASLLQYDLAGDTAKLFERYEKTRQRERRARLMNIMFMRIPLLDPDEFLLRTMALVRKLISPIGALLWLVVVGNAIKVAVEHAPQLREQSQGVLAPGNLLLLYAGMVLVKGLHEFGHAYFCRRFGGEVHVMGIMFLIFTPMPYVDATSSWGFRERWKRALVGAAGMIVELFIAALATFLWARTGPGTVHSLAYNIMFVASVSTLVFNLNPLLRYDGYYILSDLLEIPNLHQRAMGQLRFLAEKYLFNLLHVENQAHSRREAWLLATFGILSGCYRIVVFSAILLFVADRFLIIGILMAAVCAVSWVIVPTVRFVNYLAADRRLDRRRPRAIAVSIGLAAVLLFLLAVVPFPRHFRAPGILESRQWSEVVNESTGLLQTVLAQPGSRVTRGQPLLQLENKELELQVTSARAAREETAARLRKAMQDATPDLKPLQSRLDAILKRVQRLENDQTNLVIRARQDGLWVSPQLKESVGRWLDRGTPLGLLLDPAHYEFTATVAQDDGDAIFAANTPAATIRLRGQAEKLLKIDSMRIVQAEQRNLPSRALGWAGGGEVSVVPTDPQGTKAAEPFFAVRAEVVADGNIALLHGRAGKIRFDLDAEPLLQGWIRRLRQLLQKRYQL